MEKLKKYFGSVNMSWLTVIIMAVAAAVFTAVMSIIPFLKDTSFTDIAVYPDCWFIFAVFIIVNCKKIWEASLKCFVFFLISQPLIYLLQVPFSPLGWGIFGYYKFWFIVTVLTLPGAALAFLVKKKNLISMIVLLVATGYLSFAGAGYFMSVFYSFPKHLLSFVFCLSAAVVLTFILLDNKKHIIISLVAISAIFVVTLFASGFGKTESEQITLPAGKWTCSVDDESVAKVEMQSGNTALVTAKGNGNAHVVFKNSMGKITEYYISVSQNDLYIQKFKD